MKIVLDSTNRTFKLVKKTTSVVLRQVGRRGIPGAGVAPGGTTGRVLAKASNSDYDTEWVEIPSDSVTSVNGQTGVVVLDKADIGLDNVDNTSDADKPISDDTQTALDNKLNVSLKGSVDGLAELDGSGKVPSSQLPSYVDDVVTVATYTDLPVTGETGKIYIVSDTNLTFRWSGSAYVEISASLALGETSATAYRGDRGKTAYDHTLLTDNPHSVTKSQVGLSNVDNTSDATKNSASATLTNKTIDLTNNTVTMTKAQLNTAVSDGDVLYVGDVVSSQWVTTGSDIYYTTGRVSLMTTAPTHTLTLGSTSTGISLYNTVDQTTNYERVRQYWSGNVFYTVSEQGGSGITRSIRISAGLSYGYLAVNNSHTGNGFVQSSLSSGASGSVTHGVNGTLNATSGTQYGIAISPTIAQSSTAGYSALLVNPTETATGSGAKLLIDAQVGGVSKFAVDKFGYVLANGGLRIGDGSNMFFGSTTGTKLGTATSEKLSFWNKTPIVQPTTAVSGATLVSNGGTALTSTDTIGGYTLLQVVQALQNIGLLA